LACRMTHITKLLFVALAPAANQKVQPLLDPHHQRHRLVHELREYPDHFPALRRVFANEFHQDRLPPIPPCESRRIADWRRVVWFLRHQAVPPAGVSNQFISRHSRSAIRARCNITQRSLSLMVRIAQASLLATPSISRLVKGTDFFRQFEEAMTHDLPEFGTMHHLIRLGFPFM